MNFLIDPLIESDLDLKRIVDTAQIASELRNRSARLEPGRAGPVKTNLTRARPARIRPGPVDTSTVNVYMYNCISSRSTYTLYLLMDMHRDVIIYAWETGKRSTNHFNN